MRIPQQVVDGDQIALVIEVVVELLTVWHGHVRDRRQVIQIRILTAVPDRGSIRLCHTVYPIRRFVVVFDGERQAVVVNSFDQGIHLRFNITLHHH